MSLTTQQLDAISSLLLGVAPDANPLATLRGQLKGVPFTRCTPEDMRGETPYRRLPHFDLYLVDAASHCWQLVALPQQASGVIVAARGG